MTRHWHASPNPLSGGSYERLVVVKKYNAHIMYNYAISQKNTTKGELYLKGIITRWYIVYRSKMHEEQQKK